jgi:Inner membrane protein YgaP-like, transmembrane domain
MDMMAYEVETKLQTKSETKLETIQNIGLVDRLVRFSLATVFLAVPAYELVVMGDHFALSYGLLMLLSIYPALTGMLGWDPYYQLTGAKSCGTTERNQCGTLPYEIDAALGHHPIPNNDSDHSLAGSHH